MSQPKDKNLTVNDRTEMNGTEEECVDSFVPGNITFADWEAEKIEDNLSEIDVKFMKTLQASFNVEKNKKKKE
jgi:1-deoxy-D-xylulose 5-phosphate reductoisomerase